MRCGPTGRSPPTPKLAVQDDDRAGKSSAEKRAAIADWLAERKADAVVLSALDSIAWTLERARAGRGAYARSRWPMRSSMPTAPPTCSSRRKRSGDEVLQHLGNAVRVRDRSEFAEALGAYAGKRVAADPERAVSAIFSRLEAGGATVLSFRDPVVLAKAMKNPVEIAGHRAASVRDGAALARFLKWVEEEAPKGGQTELSCVAKLQAFREATGVLRDTSFDTISATGAHGASPHYHSTPESNAPLELGQLYLVDSGGQYADGTTDVTRVLPIGTPSEEMRDRFTRVLKGHIGLATAIFPPGTNGGQLDSFARRPLWEAGLDFAHGTGHGVGAYLAVHEGPQRIAKPNYPGGGPSEPLRAGMIISNEPGYYKAGEYGIRIENLILVEERTHPRRRRADARRSRR